jgi:phosphate transport system substrate-binding protein
MADRSRQRDSSVSGDARRHNDAPRRLVAALGCVAVLGCAVIAAPVRAEARSAVVTPNDQLTHGQFVDVSWAGFGADASVRVRLCPASAVKADDCAKSSSSGREPGDTRGAISGDNGAGSIPFIIKAGDVERVIGDEPFFCDAENTCQIVVSELDANNAERGFKNEFSVAVDLHYAISTVPCPFGGDRVAGSGGSSARGAMVQWQSEACRDPLNLNVSYIISNSVQGTDAFVQGLPDSDYAISGMPLTAEQNAALQEKQISPVYAPVTAGSLVFVYNLWFDRDGDGTKEQMKDLSLSPATLAAMMQGRINTWNDARIAADNPGITMPTKQVKPVARADNCAATWWFTTWMWERAQDEWKAGGPEFQSGPSTIFPAGRGVILATGTDAVANYVRNFPGEQADDNADIPVAGLIGFVYYSEALKLGLPVVALKNAGGSYVKPTTENVTAALNAGTVSVDGVFSPNFASTDATAYPLPVASYLIAPSGSSAGVDEKKAETLGRFLMYSTGAGQQAATSRGYVPLTTPLKAAADAGAEKIATTPAEEMEPPPTAVVAAPVASAEPTDLAPAATLSTTPDTEAAPAQSGMEGAAAPVAPTVESASAAQAAAPFADAASGDDSPSGPLAPVEQAVETVRRTVAGVIGLGAMGSVPIGLPVLALGAICAVLLGRLVLRMAQRRALGDGPDVDIAATEPAPSATAKVLRFAGTLRSRT